jgi:hypothetical protein
MEYSYLPVAGSTVAFHETCALVVISVSIYGLAVTISQSFHRDGEGGHESLQEVLVWSFLMGSPGFTISYYIIISSISALHFELHLLFSVRQLKWLLPRRILRWCLPGLAVDPISPVFLTAGWFVKVTPYYLSLPQDWSETNVKPWQSSSFSLRGSMVCFEFALPHIGDIRYLFRCWVIFFETIPWIPPVTHATLKHLAEGILHWLFGHASPMDIGSNLKLAYCGWFLIQFQCGWAVWKRFAIWDCDLKWFEHIWKETKPMTFRDFYGFVGWCFQILILGSKSRWSLILGTNNSDNVH